MTNQELTDTLALVVFRRLPRTTSRQAQDARRLAKEIAIGVMDELDHINRMEGNI